MTAARPERLARAPVIPVLTIKDAGTAVELARALARGGLRVLEVTLRTPAALDAIRRIKGEVASVLVGAGTVLDAAQVAAAEKAGAEFMVAPGASPRLIDAAVDSPLPFLPGASTASECMVLLERGFGFQKLFPAEACGGTAFLKAIQGPLPEITFCPTGGLGEANAAAYLALPNVACIGASWPAPEPLIAAGAWETIEAKARLAAALPHNRSAPSIASAGSRQ